MIDALVIGAGQAGLATAHALRTAGVVPVVLEAGPEPVGSWPSYYDSLTLFSPARYSALPGLRFPGNPDRYPGRDDVVDYLRRYAKNLDADIRVGHRVRSVRRDGDGWTVATDDSALRARIVVCASGYFGRPHRPPLPGFTGTVLHSSDYREPSPFAGQRVVVVGAGNSAVQIAADLAPHARVTLASRTPVRFVPQRPLGRDVHFWSTRSGVDALPIGPLLRDPPSSPVLDDGRYQRAVTDRRPLHTVADGTRLTWPDGTSEHVDTVILATGYRPDVPYLADPGQPRRGLSVHPGLGFVGMEWQRSLASATLRGVGRDARYVVKRLLRRTAGSSR
ncbi:NAD(P)/FAD-dependent oxidoreductase [Actinokineospora sp. UTMC 2448]|uniref:flavin-containing monooxygenase n=1 Tax=Actinokineospora sp. UTMC 2448 TaxID=2268449 RepID=UPI002164D403|nr:NAD(P)/FAD-dependent oxidoreductase [Actinokineospora sp. UTMC 2448]UVS79830.1 putative oxidoreductase CzcO [Actinokineospora sp. UTMC 2448]